MNPQSNSFVPIMAPPTNAGTARAAPMVISDVNYVDTLAERVYTIGVQAGTIQVPTTGHAQAITAQKKRELEKIVQKLGLRTAYAAGGQKIKIVTNHLSFVAPARIYVYSLDMIRDWDPITQNRPIPVKKQWDKLQVIDTVADLQHLWRHHLHTVRHNWVTDGDLIWSTVPLFGLSRTAQAPLTLLDPAPAIQYDNETGDRLTVRQVQVKYDRTIVITNTPVGELFYDATAPTFSDSLPGILTRGLNALLTRHARGMVGPAQNQNTSSGINRSFQNFVIAHLNQTHQQTVMAMQGYFLSVRPGVERMYININHATSPFLESILVSDFITRAINTGRNMAEIHALLKGIKVRIQYNTNQGWAVPSARNRFIERVGSLTIGQQPPNPDFNATPTVHAWYAANSPFRQHRMFPSPALNANRNAWAINCGKSPDRSQREVEWIPADQLLILPWQAFKGRLTGSETDEMIKIAMRDPVPHQTDLATNGLTPATIRGGLAHFGFTAQANTQQGFLGRAGVGAGLQFVSIDAHTLPAPKVVYREVNLKDKKNAPITNASWNLAGVAFASSPNPLIQQLLVLRPNNVQVPQDFGPLLWTQLTSHGLIPANTQLNVVTRVWQLPTGHNQALSQNWEQVFSTALQSFPAVQQHLQNQKKKGAVAKADLGPVVLVVIPRKDYDQYACIKRVGDLQLGINTICVRADNLNKSRGWNVQKASNIALKFNIKGSADTHRLENPHLAVLRKPDSPLIANTLVLGADVAHPTKGCLNGTPSVSAVVGTVDDNFIQYRGSMRLQRGRREEIGFLQEMVEERVLGWAQSHGDQFPANILFYRDGVSESQYDMVRTHEIPQIQNALNEADRRLKARANEVSTAPEAISPPVLTQNTNRQQRAQKEATEYRKWADEVMAQPNNISCKITFVVVGKRHNTRFYPTHGDKKQLRNGNCPPGLAVDRTITHPSSMDFYLQSHEPIKGTGRSAHYFAIQNGMNLSIDQLQGITHTFCYAYARATRGVSYCAPAYYADKLCDRGRAYTRHLLVGKTPHSLPLAPQSQNWPPRRQNQTETYEQYLDAMAQEVATRMNYFRGWRVNLQPVHQLFGQDRKLPWHRNLDTTMFWL